MAPEIDFYKNPSLEILEAAERWTKVVYSVYREGTEGRRFKIKEVYPCKITTAKGQELLGVIRTDLTDIQGGNIEVPFGAWNESQITPLDELMMKKAKAMGVVDLIGKVRYDFEKYEILGIHRSEVKNFDVIPSRAVLQVLNFRRKVAYLDETIVKKWPAEAVRVEGLARDFEEEFSGWKIEPISLTE